LGRFFNTLNLQAKLFSLFVILCIFPIACLGWTAYTISAKLLENKIQGNFNVISSQFNVTVEDYLRDFDRYSTLVYYNPQILEIFEQPYVTHKQLGYKESQDRKMIIDAILTYPFMNRSIEEIIFYGINGSVYGYSQSLEGTNSINHDYRPYDEPWYMEAQKNKGKVVITGIRQEKQFIGHPTTVITVARLLYNKNLEPTAVVAFNISPTFLRSIVQSLQLKGVFVSIVNKSGSLVYTSDEDISDQLTELYTVQGISKSKEAAMVKLNLNKGGTMVGAVNSSSYSGWNTYFLMNRAELFKDSELIKTLTIWIIFALLIISVFISWLFSRGLSKPILQLVRLMKRVQVGEFIVPELSHRRDEIGHLYQGFHHMVFNIREYIRDIEEKERLKRQAELYALRARISPHFLYNTLNSIRMLAIIQNLSQIAGLIQSFVELLKFNMKMEQELVSLKDELGLLRHYLVLMELRYANQFYLEWDVTDEEEDLLVSPMILQPIAENAIFHGLLGVTAKTTILITAVTEPEHNQLVVKVQDNGWGMSPEVLKRVTDSLGCSGQHAESGIGLQNVNERIRLRFGAEYGLSIQSALDEGTVITIRLPIIRKREENAIYVESNGSGR
jgi:two-component system sensor histidine kinase YesM